MASLRRTLTLNPSPWSPLRTFNIQHSTSNPSALSVECSSLVRGTTREKGWRNLSPLKGERNSLAARSRHFPLALAGFENHHANRQMFPKQSMNRAMFAALISLSAGWASTAETPSTKLSVRPPEFKLQTNDVVVFLGGANVVAAQETGHLETLLTVKFHGLGMRFHTLAWEGDTVYAQPRDLNFPQLKTQLQRVAATVAFLHFGQTES